MDRRAALMLVLLLAACARKAPLLEDLNRTHHEDLSRFKLQSAHGLRDGDRLTAQFLVSDSSSILTVDLRFAVGSPTTLVSGTWQWSRPDHYVSFDTGTVTAHSVTFLGGQDGPPSIGGAFELTSSYGTRCRLTLPVTVLQRPLARP